MAQKFLTPDQTGDGKQDLNLKEALAFGYLNGGLFIDSAAVGAGTGNYNTFLLLQDQQGGEAGLDSKGFNSNTSDPSNPEMGSQSKLTLLRDIPVILHTDGKLYYAFGIDLNEPDSDELVENISLDQFKVYLSNNIISTKSALDALTPIYDMDAGNDVSVLLNAGFSTGSGDDDYSVLIPAELFAGKDPATTYLYVYAQFGAADGSPPDTWGETGGFEEVSSQLASSYSGVKFHDHDGQGDRDAGDEGLAGFTLFIDADGDNKFDSGELWAKSGDGGVFTFYNLASGSKLQGNNFTTVNYTFREVLSNTDRGSGWSDAQWATFAPPTGAWEQTTDDATGDQTFSITGPASYNGLLVGNRIPTFDISGKKLIDANGNKIIDQNDATTPHAGVTIFIDDDGDGVVEATDNNGELDPGEKSTTTNASGEWSFTGLTANYTGAKVRELASSDYVTTIGGDGIAITGQPGTDQTGIIFANFEKFDISGYKWNDLNGDGDWDSGEPGIEKWKITLKIDADSNGVFETTKDVLTDANGKYSFTGLGPGKYQVVEDTSDAAWKATYNQAWNFTGESGKDLNLASLTTTPGNFGNFKLFEIKGYKWQDANGDATWNVGEKIIEDWKILIKGDLDNDGQFDDYSSSAFTDVNGQYSFSGLAPGKYQIYEENLTGWKQTYGGTEASPVIIVGESGKVFSGTKGSAVDLNFGNFNLIDLRGKKYNDLNGDGKTDGDSGLKGIKIFIDLNNNGLADEDPKYITTTDDNGNWSLTGLGPEVLGYKVLEELPSGYVQTLGTAGYEIKGDASNLNFANFKKFDVSGYKWNDLDGDKTWDPGEKVIADWKITIVGDTDNDGFYDDYSETVSTNADGLYKFSDLGPGKYKITEESRADWVNTYDGTWIFNGESGKNLAAGLEKTVEGNFGNFEKFDISGYKWNDLNGDGVWNSVELGIKDWKITLKIDADGNGVFETTKDILTDSTGKYSFTDLGPGKYQVVEDVSDTAWKASYNQAWNFTGESGKDLNLATLTTTPGNFGNFKLFEISGIKYNDNDNNGIDDGDGRIKDVVIYIDMTGNGLTDDDPQTKTLADGTWKLTGLDWTVAGKEVKEDTPNGYTQTVGQDGTIKNTEYLVVAKSGDNSQTGFDFANFKPFSISGYKYIDTNGDGSLLGDTTPHKGVTIYIDWNGNGKFDYDATTNPKELSAVTDDTGFWKITGLDSSFDGKLIREDASDQYVTTVGKDGIKIDGFSGDQEKINFGNFEKFSISGVKYDDKYGDGIDAGDGVLKGVTIFIDTDGDNKVDGDTNGNGVLEGGETWSNYAVTDQFGAWKISGLGPSVAGKEVKELTPTGYIQTVGQVGKVLDTSATYLVKTISGDNSQTSFNFANFKPDPKIDLQKSVKTDLKGYQPEDFDDNPDGLAASLNKTVTFKVVVKNTGNETLKTVTLSDSVVHTVNGVASSPQTIVYYNDGVAATLDAQNVQVDLDGDTVPDGAWSTFDTNNDGVIDAGSIKELSPGETFTLYYDITSTLGQHENTAKVTAVSAISTTDVKAQDDANYFVMPEGPGVRTPGFWQNNNNGGQFWDGVKGNEKNAGQDGFAKGELLYAVDSDGPNDGNSAVDPLEFAGGKLSNVKTAGLLLGDYNKNGVTDAGEDTIFISYEDARTLINANNGQMSNGTIKLGRDAVATWLNFLAGNDLGSGDGSARHYLEDAIDWFQEWAGKDSTKDDPTDADKFDVFDIKASNNMTSPGWLDKVDGVHDGNAMHDALDSYNNNGTINGLFISGDTDDAAFMLALQQVP